MDRDDEALGADYDRRSRIVGGGDPDGSAGGAGGKAPRGIDQLRRHVQRPQLEHPVAAKPAPAPSRSGPALASPRLSVMEWLLAIGHVAARRLRGVPRSALVRLHPKG